MPNIIAQAQFTIVDQHEYIISDTAPLNPTENTLWIDTSVEPNVEKRWNGTRWVLINDVASSPTFVQFFSDFEVAQGKISSLVQEVWNGNIESESRITQNSREISSIVSNADGLRTDIDQNAESIRLLAEGADGLQSQIDVNKEGIEANVTAIGGLGSYAQQTADKLSWVVEGDSRSEMTLTDDALRFIGNNIDLRLNEGFAVTVGDLDYAIANSSGNNIFRSTSQPGGVYKKNDLWVQPETGYTYQATGDNADIYVDETILVIGTNAVTKYGVTILQKTLLNTDLFSLVSGFPTIATVPLTGTNEALVDGSTLIIPDTTSEKYRISVSDTTILHNQFFLYVEGSYGTVSLPIVGAWRRVKDGELTHTQGQIDTITEETNKMANEVAEVKDLTREYANWMTFTNEGLRQGRAQSEYNTLIDDLGYHIEKMSETEDNRRVGSFTGKGLSTKGITLGQIIVRQSGSGGWVWQSV